MSNEDNSAEPTKVDPTALVVTQASEPQSQTLTPTGLATDGKADGIIDLQIPNLLPTDNVSEERTVKVRRTKIPVRITTIHISVIDNGYIVNLPEAGRQSDYGPDGSKHVFSGKAEMLEFIGQVVGQVTYQYNETEMRQALMDAEQADDVEFVDFGFDAPRQPTMEVQ